jgi:hypothetical protein
VLSIAATYTRALGSAGRLTVRARRGSTEQRRNNGKKSVHFSFFFFLQKIKKEPKTITHIKHKKLVSRIYQNKIF